MTDDEKAHALDEMRGRGDKPTSVVSGQWAGRRVMPKADGWLDPHEIAEPGAYGRVDAVHVGSRVTWWLSKPRRSHCDRASRRFDNCYSVDRYETLGAGRFSRMAAQRYLDNRLKRLALFQL